MIRGCPESKNFQDSLTSISKIIYLHESPHQRVTTQGGKSTFQNEFSDTSFLHFFVILKNMLSRIENKPIIEDERRGTRKWKINKKT
jgi:hypothetical protein